MSVRNAVSGELKQLSRTRLLEWFARYSLASRDPVPTEEQIRKELSPEVLATLDQQWQRPDVTHQVLFQCLQLDSSQRGWTKILSVGPGCGTKTLEEAATNHLGETPSLFFYPVAYCAKEKVDAPGAAPA